MYYPPKTPTLVDLARAGLIWPGSMHEEMKRPAHPKVLQRLAR